MDETQGLIFLLTILFTFLWVGPIFLVGRLFKKYVWDIYKVERHIRAERARHMADRRGRWDNG